MSKKKLKEIFDDEKIELVTLFGSFPKGKEEAHDVDLLCVIEDENELETPEKVCGKKLDLFEYSIEEMKKKARLNDYKLASILNDSEYLMGNKDLFRKGKSKIFKDVNEESVEHNKKQALIYVDYGHMSLAMAGYTSRRKGERELSKKDLKKAVFENQYCLPLELPAKKYFFNAVGNFSFALGYKESAIGMEKNGKVKTYEDIRNKTFNRLEDKINEVKGTKRKIKKEELSESLKLFARAENEIREI